jgi:hypothetical protein
MSCEILIASVPNACSAGMGMKDELRMKGSLGKTYVRIEAQVLLPRFLVVPVRLHIGLNLLLPSPLPSSLRVRVRATKANLHLRGHCANHHAQLSADVPTKGAARRAAGRRALLPLAGEKLVCAQQLVRRATTMVLRDRVLHSFRLHGERKGKEGKGR